MAQASSSEPVQELDERLARCEERLGYEFRDKELLTAALTHASGADHRLLSNERLEFLGDAILGAVVCEMLFLKYPEYLEGELTRVKSVIVSRKMCAKFSLALRLDECLILGKGMGTGMNVPPSVMADVFESLVAGVYLDGGHDPAREFIERCVTPELEAAATGEIGGNYKSQLQQLAQREFGSTPVYQLLDEKGPDHSKCFKVAADVDSFRYQAAWGRNKKEAEQRAASNALAQIRGEGAPYDSE